MTVNGHPWRERVEIGDATLYLGDCREILPYLGTIDAVVTDPPYGMSCNTDSTRFTGGQHKRGTGRSDWGPTTGDADVFDPSPWLQFGGTVLWGANHYSRLLPIGRTLVWIKTHPELFGSFLSDCEIGWATGGHGVFACYHQFPPPSRMSEANGSVGHQHQKPIKLMEWCLGFVRGERILDPFMGSGTTGIACTRFGRSFIGIEIEPRYFQIAVRRITETQRQGRLFEPPRPRAEQLTMLAET
jgi:site-specific DNA-methyltransferase (adenine-specific)